jgi:hypothetical protein
VVSPVRPRMSPLPAVLLGRLIEGKRVVLVPVKLLPAEPFRPDQMPGVVVRF